MKNKRTRRRSTSGRRRQSGRRQSGRRQSGPRTRRLKGGMGDGIRRVRDGIRSVYRSLRRSPPPERDSTPERGSTPERDSTPMDTIFQRDVTNLQNGVAFLKQEILSCQTELKNLMDLYEKSNKTVQDYDRLLDLLQPSPPLHNEGNRGSSVYKSRPTPEPEPEPEPKHDTAAYHQLQSQSSALDKELVRCQNKLADYKKIMSVETIQQERNDLEAEQEKKPRRIGHVRYVTDPQP